MKAFILATAMLAAAGGAFATSFASLASSDASTWTQIASNSIGGADLTWNYTVDAGKKSGTFSITSDKAVVLDLTVAVHAANASGAWLFDNLKLAANTTQSGTFAINWTNGGSQRPTFSNITLYARDVSVASAVSPVPEPGGWAMMAAALGAVALLARRNKRA